MRTRHVFHAVDSHTEGMPTRVDHRRRRRHPRRHHGRAAAALHRAPRPLRTLLMYEPRGHAAMSGAILQPPTRPDADYGVLYIEVSGLLPMCGHGTIGVATVLVETGMVPVTEPVTTVRLDTPAGLVTVDVAVEDGAAHVRHPHQRARLLPSASTARRRSRATARSPTTSPTAATSTPSSTLDALGLPFDRARKDELLAAGLAIMEAINAADRPVHPEDPAIAGVNHVYLAAPGSDARPLPARHGHPPRLVRPLPLRHRHLAPGWPSCTPAASCRCDRDFVNESFIGTEFTGRLIEETDGRRTARRRAHRHRPGLDHRHRPVPPRPGRPVPRRLPAVSPRLRTPVRPDTGDHDRDARLYAGDPRRHGRNTMGHLKQRNLVTARERLRDQVAHALRAALIAGELRPGEVYSAPGLAERLRRLRDPGARGDARPGPRGPGRARAQQGLPGHRGQRARPRPVHRAAHPDRGPHDRPVTRSAAREDLEALRPVAEEIVRAAREHDLIGYLEADRRFHLALLALAGNERLVETVGDLRKRSRLYGLTALDERGQLLPSAEEHLELLDLMLAGDAQAAEACMTRHLGHVRSLWAEGRKDAEPPAARRPRRKSAAAG